METKNYLGPRPYSDVLEHPTCTHYSKRSIPVFLLEEPVWRHAYICYACLSSSVWAFLGL